jgi:hypothetical protein
MAKMGDPLGSVFYELWQDAAFLHMKWAEYVELFGTDPSRIELLNTAAMTFFGVVQHVLWEDTLLHIARLMDKPETGRKTNLTIQRLPQLVRAPEAQGIQALVRTAITTAEFCGDWRNRRLAHTDLALALNGTSVIPLPDTSRKQVNEALGAIAVIISKVQETYLGDPASFHFISGTRGASDLLYWIREGLKANGYAA